MTTPQITDVIALPDDLTTLPDPEPFYYAVGKTSSYIVKRTMFGKALVQIDTIDHLTSPNGQLWYADAIPKVPAEIISQVWSFFRHIYKTKGSESMVYLTYKDGVWRPFVPPQSASYTHVSAKFELANLAPGWRLACSIHSHCNFGGFHSSTDEKDAREHEGLHITIGDVEEDEPSIASMISISGALFTMRPEDVIEGKLDKFTDHPAWWNHFVRGEVERPKKTGPYNGLTGLEVIELGHRERSGKGGTGEYEFERWLSDDDYIDHAMRYTDRRPYRMNISERTFFGLVEQNIRRGYATGDEEELLGWAVEMDSRLDALIDDAAAYNIDLDLFLRRARTGEDIAAPGDTTDDATDRANAFLAELNGRLP